MATVSVEITEKDTTLEVNESSGVVEVVGGTTVETLTTTTQVLEVLIAGPQGPPGAPGSGGGGVSPTAKGGIITHNGTAPVELPAGADGSLIGYNSAQATGLEAVAFAPYGGTGMVEYLLPGNHTFSNLSSLGSEPSSPSRRRSLDLNDWASVLLTGGVTTLSANIPSFVAPLYSTDSGTSWKYLDGSPFRHNSAQNGGGITVTADAGTDTFTMTNAAAGVAFAVNERVQFGAAAATTPGTLPAPLVAGTVYFVRNPSGSTFQVATASGGVAIDLTTAGTAPIQVISAPPADNLWHISLAATGFITPMGTTYRPIPADLKGQVLLRLIAIDASASASVAPIVTDMRLAFKR